MSDKSNIIPNIRQEAEEYATSASYMEMPPADNERLMLTAQREVYKEAVMLGYEAAARKHWWLAFKYNSDTIVKEAEQSAAEHVSAQFADAYPQQIDDVKRGYEEGYLNAAFKYGKARHEGLPDVLRDNAAELLEELKTAVHLIWNAAYNDGRQWALHEEAKSFADHDEDFIRITALIAKCTPQEGGSREA